MNERSQRHEPRGGEGQTPWWRIGMVWLVIGGPLLVVVASLVTTAIAVVGAEEVLTLPANVQNAAEASTLPAMQGRNHAATPKH